MSYFVISWLGGGTLTFFEFVAWLLGYKSTEKLNDALSFKKYLLIQKMTLFIFERVCNV